jgi:predicted ATPase/signal transduction histidine kinase/tRNA A-37 threonylcarbamoyl transferase component Bud32
LRAAEFAEHRTLLAGWLGGAEGFAPLVSDVMQGSLANFSVKEVLGESAHAVFYAAVDEAQNQAVIEVRRHPESDARDMGRLENEYRITSNLHTDAIVHALAVGRLDGRPAIVREEFRGTRFEQLCDGAMSTDRFLPLALAAAQALREVHVAGLIHRDIKPANLLVDETNGQVRIINLGLAILQPREQGRVTNPSLIEGTLAYMSPEQTGRMNRVVDQRSDLYSLGMTFYELLTGALPFSTTDPLEWVHCHIARPPTPPSQRQPAMPQMLSRIILKLLAKAPEDRYQSAGGLVHDLRRCEREWVGSGRIVPFALGERDLSDRWLLPQRLYGREAERQILTRALEQVGKQQGPVRVLVSGPAGSGKSELVNDLQRTLVGERQSFAAGKFDAFARDVPYATFVQAVRALVFDVLTKNDEAVARWRERLASAVRPHGQLLVELIPSLELLIGHHPPVPELGPAEAQARLDWAFRKLLKAFASPEDPLTLFLDDLQWADPGTLRLLADLAADPQASQMVIIAAYRPTEASHPVATTLETLRQLPGQVHEVALKPLGIKDLVAMTAGVLHREPGEVELLATLVRAKTGGNPFFARQFLTTLYTEGLIWFDPHVPLWRWDLARIAAQGFTDNVAEFMAGRLVRLPETTRRVLGVGALAGISWGAELISAALEMEPGAVAEILSGAVSEGFLTRRDDSYSFTHDRVRQAAYQTVPEAKRAAVHLKVGRLMLEQTPVSELGAVLFEVVHQLNLGASLIDEPAMRRRVAALNLRAGRQARRAAASASARGFFAAGSALLFGLPPDEVSFELGLENADADLLNGEHERALALLAQLLEGALDTRQKATVYRKRQGVFLLSGQTARAVEDEVAGLRVCGIELPARPTDDDVAAARARVHALLSRHPPETFLEMPELLDPDKLAASQLNTPSFFTDQRLFFVHVARMVEMSLEHGLAPNASYWFSNYALALAAFGEYREARRLAQAACDLAERQPLSPAVPEALFALGEVCFWTDSYDDAIAVMRRAYRTGLDNGAAETPLLSACVLLWLRLASGASLPETEREADEFLAVLARVKSQDMHDLVAGQRHFIRHLREETPNDFDSQRIEAPATPDRLTTALCWYWIHKLRAAYLAGEIPEALAAARRAEELLWSSRGLPPEREFVLYSALTVARAMDAASPQQRESWHAELCAHEQQLQQWAQLNPASFEHGHLFAAAELARIENRPEDALGLYDRGVRGARAGNFALDEALGWELLARFHAQHGALALARMCLGEASGCYASRGAIAKVRELRAQTAVPSTVFAPRATMVAAADELDVISVVQASQAISGEVTVEQVTSRLMELVLAQGGAERGLLLLADGDHLRLAAEAISTGSGTRVSLSEHGGALVEPLSAPLSVLQYVWRTAEGLLLDDATREPRYAPDEYVAQRRPRSLLCTPIRRHGQVVGLLYLENRAVAAAFNRTRLQVLELFAAQVAISLQNAALLAQEREARDLARQAQSRAALLSDASALLGESLEFSEGLARLARLLKERLANWCVIELVGSGAKFEAGKNRSEQHTATVPLVRHGNILGTLSLGSEQPLGEANFKLIEEIARRAALAIENGELFRKSEEAVRVREEFLSVASHELNTPLAGLTLSVQALRKQYSSDRGRPRLMSDAMTQQLSELVDRNAQRLSRLVRDLLDATKLQHNQLALHPEKIDLGALIRDNLQRFMPQLERAHCTLSTALEPGLVVHGDRGRLEQVLVNLLANAIKFGPGRSIHVSARSLAGAAQLSVRDHGMGIERSQQKRIFERFERGVSASNYGGLGLGLYISREIVTAHHGWIRVDSEPGEGATFIVELPLAEEVDASADAEHPPP